MTTGQRPYLRAPTYVQTGTTFSTSGLSIYIGEKASITFPIHQPRKAPRLAHLLEHVPKDPFGIRSSLSKGLCPLSFSVPVWGSSFLIRFGGALGTSRCPR